MRNAGDVDARTERRRGYDIGRLASNLSLEADLALGGE